MDFTKIVKTSIKIKYADLNSKDAMSKVDVKPNFHSKKGHEKNSVQNLIIHGVITICNRSQ